MIVKKMFGWVVPLTAGLLVSVAVSMLIAIAITAADINGTMAVVVAVATWSAAIGTALALHTR